MTATTRKTHTKHAPTTPTTPGVKLNEHTAGQHQQATGIGTIPAATGTNPAG